jgi:hypothetical protein
LQRRGLFSLRAHLFVRRNGLPVARLTGKHGREARIRDADRSNVDATQGTSVTFDREDMALRFNRATGHPEEVHSMRMIAGDVVSTVAVVYDFDSERLTLREDASAIDGYELYPDPRSNYVTDPAPQGISSDR